MYQVDILTNKYKWQEFYSSENIKEIDVVVWKLTNIRPGKGLRIMEDDKLLCFLNGSEQQYWYWKNVYVRERGSNYDFTKSFYEYKKRKEDK